MNGRPRPLRLFLLFAGVSFLTRLVLLGVPFVDLDEAAYLTAARELLRGGLLYVDAADHKPPLVFAFYALAQGLGDGMLPVRLLASLLVVPLTALGLSALFRHDRRGIAAGLLYLVSSASFLGHDMLAVNCELLMLAPLAWALPALRDADAHAHPERLLRAALLVGVAVLFKYQAAAWAPALLLPLPAEPRKGRRALLVAGLALAVAAPALGAYAAFAALGAGSEFLYWNWTHNVAYAASPLPAAAALERIAAYVLPFLLATAPLAWACRRGLPLLPAHLRRLVFALLLLSALEALPGLRVYPHYLIPLYAPLALGAAPWAAAELRRPLRGRARAFVAVTGLLLAGFTAANGYLYLARDDVYTETRPVFREVAERLRSDPCAETGGLFVWGFAPIFYGESRLPPASRFLFVGFSLVGHVSGNPELGADLVRREHWELLLGDLERSRPAFVLDTARARLSRWNAPLQDHPRLAAFVARGYEAAGAVDGVVIYRRRGCVP